MLALSLFIFIIGFTAGLTFAIVVGSNDAAPIQDYNDESYNDADKLN